VEPNFIIINGADPLNYFWRAFPELQAEIDDGDSGRTSSIHNLLTTSCRTVMMINFGDDLTGSSSRWLLAGAIWRKSL